MATYFVLANWTQKGIENVKDSPKRLGQVKKEWAQMGAKVKAFYLTMGQYDMALIVDAPDDETVAKVALATGAKGSVRTVTMRVFPEDEYRALISSLA